MTPHLVDADVVRSAAENSSRARKRAAPMILSYSWKESWKRRAARGRFARISTTCRPTRTARRREPVPCAGKGGCGGRRLRRLRGGCADGGRAPAARDGCRHAARLRRRHAAGDADAAGVGAAPPAGRCRRPPQPMPAGRRRAGRAAGERPAAPAGTAARPAIDGERPLSECVPRSGDGLAPAPCAAARMQATAAPGCPAARRRN